MDILRIAQRYVNLSRSGARYSGPCPKCAGSAKSNKFNVYPAKNDCHCFSCGLHGGPVALLRAVENIGCADAYEQLQIDCEERDCDYWSKCRLGARANGKTVAKKKQKQSIQPPVEKPQPEYTPAAAIPPEQRWQQQATALIAKAHAALLDCPEQIDYLTQRGMPIEAIKAAQLGWLPENRYPSRRNWGLPEKLKDGRVVKSFIPSGILIPFFDAERTPMRIRIRRNDIRPQDGRYFWLEGSGNDVPVIGGTNRRGVVVVESDLDAFMVRWQCRDLDVSVIPLGTCGAKPKQAAWDFLKNALAILVAHDFEPRHNETTGHPENPGGQGARWWLKQFQRAQRWPVPVEKDPGEAYQQGVNIRQWVLQGLPPVFHAQISPPVESTPASPAPIPAHAKGETISGHGYVIAKQAADVSDLQQIYPDHVIFTPAEIAELKGMDKTAAETILLAKKTFSGQIIKTQPLPAGQVVPTAPAAPVPETEQEELSL